MTFNTASRGVTRASASTETQQLIEEAEKMASHSAQQRAGSKPKRSFAELAADYWQKRKAKESAA